MLSTTKIFDLHCDLLSYLQNSSTYTPYDHVVRCSIPQWKKGGVKGQTLAIFTETGEDSVKKGMEQFKIFRSLEEDYPQDLEFFKGSEDFRVEREREDIQVEKREKDNKISVLLSIENASSFSCELEPLEVGLERLREVKRLVGRVFYISLTWNSENRFGGGAFTNVGLKEDGEILIRLMDELNIPIDFSHTSDRLAFDILNFLEKESLAVPILASHSNMRAVTDAPRNLPDELVKEIIRRDGIIGLVFVKKFVGERKENLVNHLFHLLELGGENNVSFGADFFWDDDLPELYRNPSGSSFFKTLGDASVYPSILSMFQQFLSKSDVYGERVKGSMVGSSVGKRVAIETFEEVNILEKIAHGNLLRFLKLNGL